MTVIISQLYMSLVYSDSIKVHITANMKYIILSPNEESMMTKQVIRPAKQKHSITHT
jgi:hypothetical protein